MSICNQIPEKGTILMRFTRRISACLLVLTGVSVTGPAVSAQEEEYSAEAMAEMMAKWMAVIEPSENHKHLDYFVGSWETVTRIWMAGPDQPPTVAEGESKMEWILDGRFIAQHFEGEVIMPTPDGGMAPQPMEGFGVTGFDNFRQLYTMFWIDNVNTAIHSGKGSRNPVTGHYDFYGDMDEPMLDLVGRTVRYSNQLIDEDHFLFVVYDLHAGPDYKAFEISYTRKTEQPEK